MFNRALLVALIAFFAGAGLLARAAAPSACKGETCEGAFDVGPYRLVFFATQRNEEGATERHYREIPSFGPTRLNLEISRLRG